MDPYLPAIAKQLAPGREASTLEWLRSGLDGPWDDAFFSDRAERARRTTDHNVSGSDIVGFIHRVRHAYAAIIEEPAFDKLLDLELAIVLHVREADAGRRHVDQRAAMQTLTTGFAHELRNPLNSARLQLDVLERRIRRYVEDPAVAEPAALARQEVERLCALVEDFLAFAQPPALVPAMCDLVTLVEHVVEVEQAFAGSRGVTLALERPRSRWHARIDADKVRQVVMNLVRNAVEAAPTGGHVDVRITGDQERVHITVSDDGPGIPERVRSRMFEPFFSTKDTGTGLGMSIVQSLVAMHGGTIDVESNAQGTRFDVALPRAA